jgi:multidrug efflux pump subunit AcrA (membrane-fusion protein)
VDGRVSDWHIKEGDKVRVGQRLVSIQDPDPNLQRRLADQRQAIQERSKAAMDRITSFTQQIYSLENSREKAILAAKNRLAMSREREKAAHQGVTAAVAKLRADAISFGMQEELKRDGLTSELNYQTVKARMEQSQADKERSHNALQAAKEEVKAIDADMDTIDNNAKASIASATASKQSAEAELASAQRDLADIDIRIARQSTQEVSSPCKGTVYRIVTNADKGGALVKAGDRLLIITPDIGEDHTRTVELFLDGNDSPQLLKLWESRGEEQTIRVRVQFEGWPAVQFVGWPSFAYGTFGGKVIFVDPHDDGKGRFRILVQPDEADVSWPDGYTLRQGTRAQGWVLLDEVSIGWELWRRFNGFPQVIPGKDKDDNGGKSKPGKVKVPK